MTHALEAQLAELGTAHPQVGHLVEAVPVRLEGGLRVVGPGRQGALDDDDVAAELTRVIEDFRANGSW